MPAETLGVPIEKVLGRKCYGSDPGQDIAMSFCTNDRITEDEFTRTRILQSVLNHRIYDQNRVIDWGRTSGGTELSHDDDSAGI